jgi:hypothetical protein
MGGLEHKSVSGDQSYWYFSQIETFRSGYMKMEVLIFHRELFEIKQAKL